MNGIFCTFSQNLRSINQMFLLLTPATGTGKPLEGTDPAQGLEKER